MSQYTTHLIDAITSVTDGDTCKRILDLADSLETETKAYYEGLKHEKRPKLLRNRVKCLYCMDIIESLYVHDFRYCKCEKTFVDGGLCYSRYGSEDLKMVKDMCKYEKPKGNPVSSSLTNAQYDDVMKVGKKE